MEPGRDLQRKNAKEKSALSLRQRHSEFGSRVTAVGKILNNEAEVVVGLFSAVDHLNQAYNPEAS